MSAVCCNNPTGQTALKLAAESSKHFFGSCTCKDVFRIGLAGWSLQELCSLMTSGKKTDRWLILLCWPLISLSATLEWHFLVAVDSSHEMSRNGQSLSYESCLLRHLRRWEKHVTQPDLGPSDSLVEVHAKQRVKVQTVRMGV